jgi:ribosomal peptide maturation radical SAM protein 1
MAGNGLAAALPESTVAQRRDLPVALVSMPFMDVHRPSIQLGLLGAIAQAHGFPVQTVHANLDFAAQIGIEYYGNLAEYRSRLVGDWLFSVEAFGDAAPDRDGQLIEQFADDLSYLGASRPGLRKRLLGTRRRDVPAYLDALVNSHAWGDARVVAFSCTFQQNGASFALARRLKQRWPHLVMVFGGANFDGEMGLELVRAVQCIDAAVIGEGDTAFPRLLCALASGAEPGAIPGVARRVGEHVAYRAAEAPLERLDDLPVPDYAEYFDRAERFGVLPAVGHRQVWIPFESARGCWWGEQHHCTFCGLNGSTMRFRSKSPERVLTELAQQARQYRSFRFQAVDNILDMSYLKALLPAITASGADYEIFYEVKANLTRAQLRLMAQSGVRHIQPGIESLSSAVLRLMRKGVRAAQNVNVLRWSQYYGIQVGWNILWGFPGEVEQDYSAQAAVIPYLAHLPPPMSAARIWIERFSPLFNSSEARFKAPEGSYRYVYPDTVDIDRIAYFFDCDLSGTLPDSAYSGVRTAVDTWSAAWQASQPPVLKYWSAPGFLQIYDGRRPGHEGTYTFDGAIARIYLACSDRPMTAAAVRESLGLAQPPEFVHEVFKEFCERGLMFLDEPFALALALPAAPGR